MSEIKRCVRDKNDVWKSSLKVIFDKVQVMPEFFSLSGESTATTCSNTVI